MSTYVEPKEQLMVEVYVRNLEASSTFYRRLGFDVVRQEEGFMELQWDGVPFALKVLPEAPFYRDSWQRKALS
jgi:catechol 2,3-dioxygenase-like lactoylglutathione lyase family enzyme